MNTRKLIGSVAAIGSMALMAAGAQAQQQQFASASAVGTDGAAQVFTFTGGSAGTFSTTSGAVFSSIFTGTGIQTIPSVLTFSGLTVASTATGSGIAGDPFRELLGSGSFMLTGGGSTLLMGSFTDGNVLTAETAAQTGTLTTSVNNVTYTGGTYFAAANLNNPGSFAISMTSAAPQPTKDQFGYLNGFKASGSINFSATKPTAVPEPASVIPFALGGLGLLGLIARKTRRTSGAAA